MNAPVKAPASDREVTANHNGAPPSAYEAHRVNIEDLYLEAKNWCDGEPIATQAQANEVSRLLGLIRQAEKAADDSRRAEVKPFDDAKAEVQDRYNLLIGATKAVKGKTVLATEACKAALAPFLRAQEEAHQRQAAESRRAAEEAAQLAAAAARSASPDDLEAREQTEDLVTLARQAERAARKAENTGARADGLERAVTLRSYWSAEIEDLGVAARHYWQASPDAIRELIHRLATADVQAGRRNIPGIRTVEERRPV